MKKAIGFVLILLLLSLTACASLGDEGDIIPPNTADNPDHTAGDVHGEQAEINIQETTLLDESGIKIVAKEIDFDGLFGPQLKLFIENNTNTDLTIQSRNASVNGYMIETMMSVDVAAGKKANDSLTFMSSDLEKCGIETFADMEFSFHIFKSEGWDAYLDTELIQIKTSAADTYQYTYDHEGQLLYEGEGVKIIAKGLSTNDSIFGPGLIVYIHNTGEKAITVQTRETSVNGFMVDTIFSQDVAAGKHAVSAITFMQSQLKENEITQITDAEFSFHIFDAETWKTIADTETVSLSFS